MNAARAFTPWGYLAREAALILLWSYVFLVGGTINGLLAFRVQAASAFLAVMALGPWLLWRWRQGRRLPGAGLEAAAGLFVLAQLVAVLLSQDPRRGLPLLAQSIAYLAVFYCALDLLRAGWPAELAEKTLLIVGGIVVGLALADLLRSFLSWLDLTAGQAVAPDFAYRIYVPLGDANLLAAGLVVLTPAALARALSTPRGLNRGLLAAGLGAALLALVFTSSRGGTAGLAAGLGTLAALWVSLVSTSARNRLLRWWAVLRARPPLLAAFGLLALVGLALVAWRVLNFEGSATQAPALFARQEFWPAAVNAWRESPIWGQGPGTYPSEFMRFNSVPPGRVYLHAHSVLLNTAGEAGLLGLAATGFAVFAIGRALWRARHKPSVEARARWAAAAAAWVGFLVHSQVDDHTRYLTVAVPLAVLLAAALAEGEGPAAPRRDLHPLWLLLPGLAAAAFAAYALRAYALSEQAVEAGQAGDWARAAQGFDAAAAADPALAFYWEQAGYAYGRLAAAGDQAALAAAMDRLERGAAREPRYSVTFANLAAVYWQAGRREDAVAAMRQAVALAPAAADFHLNLGLYLEALDPEAEAARAAFRRALDSDVRVADASLWVATPLRQAVRAQWKAEQPAEAVLPLDRVRDQIAAGQAAAAERDLLALWGQDDQDLLVYAGLAEVARAQGDLDLAEVMARNALSVQTARVDFQVEAMLVAAEIARARGQTDLALGRYQAAFGAVTEYGSLGWGTAGWTPHAFFAFQRRGLPLDVLPQLTRGDFSPALGRQLVALGELFVASGQPEQAAAVYRRLLALEPGLDEARQALAQLEAGAP